MCLYLNSRVTCICSRTGMPGRLLRHRVPEHLQLWHGLHVRPRDGQVRMSSRLHGHTVRSALSPGHLGAGLQAGLWVRQRRQLWGHQRPVHLPTRLPRGPMWRAWVLWRHKITNVRMIYSASCCKHVLPGNVRVVHFRYQRFSQCETSDIC